VSRAWLLWSDILAFAPSLVDPASQDWRIHRKPDPAAEICAAIAWRSIAHAP